MWNVTEIVIKKGSKFPWAESESGSTKVVVEKTHKWKKVKWTPMTEERGRGWGRKRTKMYTGAPWRLYLRKKLGSHQNGVQALPPINYSTLEKLLNLPMLFLVNKFGVTAVLAL